MKNFNITKITNRKAISLLLAGAITMQTLTTFAMPQWATNVKSSAANFYNNHKTATKVTSAITGAGLLSGVGALVYKMTRPVAIKKTGLSALSKVGIGAAGVAITVAGVIGLYFWNEKRKSDNKKKQIEESKKKQIEKQKLDIKNGSQSTQIIFCTLTEEEIHEEFEKLNLKKEYELGPKTTSFGIFVELKKEEKNQELLKKANEDEEFRQQNEVKEQLKNEERIHEEKADPSKDKFDLK